MKQESRQLIVRIENARQEHCEGKILRFQNASAAQKWMEQL